MHKRWLNRLPIELSIHAMAVARMIGLESCCGRDGCSAFSQKHITLVICFRGDSTLKLNLILFSIRLELICLEWEEQQGIPNKNSMVYTFRGRVISKSSLLLFLVLWRKKSIRALVLVF